MRKQSQQEAIDAIRLRPVEYYSPEEAELWLNSPHTQLEGRRAMNLIRAGKAQEVHRFLDRLDADAYS
ncbi:MAG: MbcA/ParS/Xre antitoxin family protein [Pseudomonadota bacterium]